MRLHAGPQAGIEIPQPLQHRRNVFHRQRDHGVDRHADRHFRQRGVHVPSPGEDDPVKIPRTPRINAEQQQPAGVSQKTGQQRHPHQRVQPFSAEDPRRNSHRECARAQRGQHHQVEGLPDAPAIGVVHSADRAESGQFAIPAQHERHQHQRRQAEKKSVDHREPVHGHVPFPAIAASAIDAAIALVVVALVVLRHS